ncbi:MAG: hypothetical protein ACI9KF_001024 [Arenicella sp.]
MQALEKIVIHTNWVSFILVFLFAIIAILKIIDAEKLKGYAFAVFNKSFLEDEVEEDTSFFSSFYSLLFLFSCTVLALVISLLISERNEDFSFSFSFFLFVLGIIFSYFTLKSILELLIVRLFLIKKQVRFYIVSKFGYLYSISFFLLVLFVLFQFGPLNFSFFITIASGFFFLNFVFHVFNNKKLVFSKLFYYILYLCAFEISPLIIMFKLML